MNLSCTLGGIRREEGEAGDILPPAWSDIGPPPDSCQGIPSQTAVKKRILLTSVRKFLLTSVKNCPKNYLEDGYKYSKHLPGPLSLPTLLCIIRGAQTNIQNRLFIFDQLVFKHITIIP